VTGEGHVPVRTVEPTALGPGAAVLAFDVGGTDLKAMLVDSDGRRVDTVRVPTPRDAARPGEAVLAEVARLTDRFSAASPTVVPLAAGLIVPGHVDDRAGIGVHSENLGWRDMPFRERATELLGLPVSFGHDARGAGDAEHRLGAASGFSDVLVLTVGTGIAAAVIIDGQVYRGDGRVGEIGHAKVADGPRCACGARGCLEAVASAASIARRYNDLAGAQVHGSREVHDRMLDGDEKARHVWESAVDALALGLSQTVALLSPEAIVIGGGLSEAGDDLFVPLRSRLDARLTFHRRPALLRAAIGGDAGLLGAALGARDLVAPRAGEPAAGPGGSRTVAAG
jgi:glucokinase